MKEMKMKERGRKHLLSVVNSTAKQAMQQNKPLVSTHSDQGCSFSTDKRHIHLKFTFS